MATNDTYIEQLLEEANAGNLKAQRSLGSHYLNGMSVPKDRKKGSEWYRKAAEGGDKDSQARLGRLYKEGEGVEKNLKKAYKWYRKAAEQGDEEAQFQLGLMHMRGNGVEEDIKQACEWFQKAHENGNEFAAKYIVKAQSGHHEDKRKRREIDKIVSSFGAEIGIDKILKEANSGDAEAQFDLGQAYKKGQGVPKNNEEALKWYKKAAKQGHFKAQFALGIIYDKLQKYEKSVFWYQKAAEQGYVLAQYNLGVAYAIGQGVTKSIEQAREWYQKAAAQEDTDAQQALEKLPKPTPLEAPKRPSLPAPKRAAPVAPKNSHLENKDNTESNSLIKQFEQQLYRHRIETERQIKEILQAAQSAGKSKTDSKVNEEQITQNILQKLLEKQETSQVGQKTSQNVENELQSLNARYEEVNARLIKLRVQAKTDSSVRDQLRQLEEDVKPLIEKHNEERRILQIEMYIFQNLSLKTFYNQLQKKLNRLFFAYMAISSNTIDRTEDNVNSTIGLIGKAFNVVTFGISSVVAGGVNGFYNRRENKKIAKIVDPFVTITACQELVQRVALELTQRYEEQINETTPPGKESRWNKYTFSQDPNGGSETLAECAVKRILSAFEKGKIDPVKPLDEEMIECVFLDTEKNSNIQNKKGVDWTDAGVFRESGIKTSDNKWFAGKSGCCHKPETYGYRLGTEAEATKLKLLQQKVPAGRAVNAVSSALGKQVTELSDDAKRAKEKLELQSKFHLNTEDRTAKLERQLAEERKQREDERIEREKKDSEARKREQETVRKVAEMEKQLQQLMAEKGRGSDPSNLVSLNTKSAQPVLLSPSSRGNGSASPLSPQLTGQKSTVVAQKGRNNGVVSYS